MIFAKNRYYFLLVGILLILQGCLGTKHLKENEQILYKQHVDAPKGFATSLKPLYVQETNKKLIGLPLHTLVGVYYFGLKRYNPDKLERKISAIEEKYDTRMREAKSDKRAANLQFKKLRKTETLKEKLEKGNLLMQWGEPLALFDSAKVKLTEERFSEYLFTNGYFKNSISSTVKQRSGKLKDVTYSVVPGDPYRIDTIFYRIPDSSVLDHIQKISAASFLKPGDRYIQDNFSKERERIDLALKEVGYYDFSRQYVEFDIDTAYRKNKKVAVQVIINDPAKRGYHKKFNIDEVHFITDAGISLPGVNRIKETYHNMSIEYYEKLYNPKILSQRTFIYPGDTYSRSNTFDTQRQLANLDVFKFVNVNFDTTGGKFIANIFTSALDRYQWSNEVGMNVTQGFPGPFLNINFKKRNIFRGLENFEMNGRIGYEGVASATENNNVYQSIEAGINASITFPQFLLPLKEETRYKLGRINPRTKALVGYTYTDRPEYKRAATTFNYIYSWENKRIRRFDLTVGNLSIIDSKTDTTFQNLLDSLFLYEGNTLYLTFQPSFVSSIIFNMSWNHNNYGNLEKSSVFFRWSLESGGTLQNLFDYPIIERRNLQSFQYLRLSADIRRLQVLDKNTTLAYRFNGGVGYSYSVDNVLPYEKYFFAGGSSSVRAWRPRRLGPGSFRPPASDTPASDGLYDYQNEQPGEILLETSIELRRKLVGFFEGAVFLDAGNVWLFEQRQRFINDELVDNGNAQFNLGKFYKEFGIGTGFGLRFNFSFLIVRFDVGMKVYDPGRLEGDRFVLNKIKFLRPFGTNREPVIYNFGIGFPF